MFPTTNGAAGAPAADPSTDPSADPSATGGDDDQGGYTIEIEVSGDGSITVSVESAATEGAESTGDESKDEASAQPAANIKEALTLALGAYKNNGQLPDAKGANDQFDQGFGSGPGGASGSPAAAGAAQ